MTIATFCITAYFFSQSPRASHEPRTQFDEHLMNHGVVTSNIDSNRDMHTYTTRKLTSKRHPERTLTASSELERILAIAPLLGDVLQKSGDELRVLGDNNTADDYIDVVVWNKAAIGMYFWSEVFGADIEPQDPQLLRSSGTFILERLRITFITGYGVQLQAMGVPPTTRILVLILNAHEPERESKAAEWLDATPAFKSILHVGLILHGQESCRNDWLKPYLVDSRYKLRFVFVTYATDLIDNKLVFQWPLGIAMYRGFPSTKTTAIDINDSLLTRNLCNFYGTIYRSSSREELLSTLKLLSSQFQCDVNVRHEWKLKESKETLSAYVSSLRSSLFTLAPAGQNSECYRWWEAASQGSVPIIEEITKPNTCADPFGLLKQMNAPFVFISNWTSDLQDVLKTGTYSLRSPMSLAKMRTQVRIWYAQFLEAMRIRFLGQLIDSCLTAKVF